MEKTNREKYEQALFWAMEMMDAEPELELTSALKEGASRNGIPWGDEMEDFVFWANLKLGV